MMDKLKTDKILLRMQEHLQAVTEQGYEWVGIFLQGSQNYGLDYEGSDIDTKMIVLPSIDDVILNAKPTSFTYVMPNEEHVDVKDIRLMFDCFKKQNINFIEILFTKYYILNPKYFHLFLPMLEQAEEIAHYNNYASVNCMAGMAYEKYKALEHPYPTIKWKIDKWGYDGKQLSHIMRIHDFIQRYIAGEPYNTCITPANKVEQMKAKKNEFPLEEAKSLAKWYTDDITRIKNEYMQTHEVKINEYAQKVMNEALTKLIKARFVDELEEAVF